MNLFKDMGIALELKSFQGDKIKIDRILNREITVIDYKIETSKFAEKGNGKCLYMQIEVDGTKRIVFTGSAVLMHTIQRIDQSKFPFVTTIIKQYDHFEFT